MNSVRHKIIRRLLGLTCRSASSTPVFLSYRDVQFCPSGAIDNLKSAQLIKPAAQSNAIECRGCEERCLRPVQLIEREDGVPAQLISTCDLFDDLGPFHCPSNAVARWLTSRKLIVEFFRSRRVLEIAEIDELCRRVRFRSVELDGVRRPVSLEFAGRPTVYIGSAAVPLESLIVCDDVSIRLDNEHFNECFLASDERRIGGKHYQASRSIQEANKLSTEIRDQRIQRRFAQLAGQHPKLNKEKLAKKLEKSGKAFEVSWQRIMRIVRISRKR